jgi:hypothetical protein
MIYISGPGHGGPALVGNVYLEGTFSEYYPDVPQNESGLKELFKGVFHFLEDYRVMYHRKYLDRFTKVVNSVIH